MRLAELPKNVFVGDKRACKASGPNFQRRLHIWRSDHLGGSCDPPTQSDQNNLYMDYSDGLSLSTANVELTQLVEFIRGDETLLIHCAAGQTRSPTLAVFALVVRGMDVYDAIPVVIRSCYETYGLVPNLCLTPLSEIIKSASQGLLK